MLRLFWVVAYALFCHVLWEAERLVTQLPFENSHFFSCSFWDKAHSSTPDPTSMFCWADLWQEGVTIKSQTPSWAQKTPSQAHLSNAAHLRTNCALGHLIWQAFKFGCVCMCGWVCFYFFTEPGRKRTCYWGGGERREEWVKPSASLVLFLTSFQMSTPLWIACGKLAFPVNENELANNKRESGGMLPHVLWLGLACQRRRTRWSNVWRRVLPTALPPVRLILMAWRHGLPSEVL